MNKLIIMTMKKCKKILITFALLPMIVLGCSQGIEYNGDGELERGFVLYPTFRVIFSEILINPNIVKTFNFKGLPPDELILRLALRKDLKQQELSLKELDQIWNELETTNVLMKLSISANGDGQLSVGPELLIKSWKFAAYGRKYYFWRKQFNNMRLKNNREYELKVVIKTEKALLSNIYLIPILEGGGFGKGDIFKP